MSRLKTSHPDVLLVTNTWAHFAFGDALMAPVDGYQITRERFDALLTKIEPISDSLAWHGRTFDQAWDYLLDVAPWAVGVVGVPDFSGAGP